MNAIVFVMVECKVGTVFISTVKLTHNMVMLFVQTQIVLIYKT